MSNYNDLKTRIAAAIHANGVEEITGNVLQSVLIDMVDAIGDEFSLAGVATTTTVPGTPDNKTAYIATAAGTYTNFLDSNNNPIVVPANALSALLTYDPTAGHWTGTTFGTLAPGIIGTNELADGAVTTPKIADSAVTGNKLSNGAVSNANKLASNVVTTAKIAANAVTTAKIADFSVTMNKLNSNSVSSEKMTPNAVTSRELAPASVSGDKIADGGIPAGKLANNSVATGNIQDEAVTAAKIAPASVNMSHINSGALDDVPTNGSDKLVKSGGVYSALGTKQDTIADLATIRSGAAAGATALQDIPDGGVTTPKIADGAVTIAKIAPSEIDATPTNNSGHLVTSGGVYDYLQDTAVQPADLAPIYNTGSDKIIASFDLSDFTRNYYYAVGATDVDDLTYNANMYYLLQDVPSDCKSIIVGGGYGDDYTYDTFHAFDENGDVVFESKYKELGTNFQVKATWKQFAVSVIRLGNPNVVTLRESLREAVEKSIAADSGLIASRVVDEKTNGVIAEYELADFTSGYYYALSAQTADDLTANANCAYLLRDININCEKIFVAGIWLSGSVQENFHAFDENGNVVYSVSARSQGAYYQVQPTWKKFAVSSNKRGTPIVRQIIATAGGWTLAQNRSEIMTRTALYGISKSHPFQWGAFDQLYVSFTCDDANTDVCNYFAQLRKRRMPFVPAWIPHRYSSYTYTGADHNRHNVAFEPVVGVEYALKDFSAYSYVRVYIDRRCTLSLPIVIQIGSNTHTITSPDNARFPRPTGTTTFKVVSVNGDTSEQVCKYISVIQTPHSSDNDSGMLTWSEMEVLQNIVFDFGEILAHGTAVISSTDPLEREKLIAEYLYNTPKEIDDMVGFEHCKGFILPGGPNSARGMNTQTGQIYCLRSLLYCDYLGTTPQFMIQRTSYRVLVGDYSYDGDTCQANAEAWLSAQSAGFKPLFGHSELTAEKVGRVADACIAQNVPVHTWRSVYELFAD